MPPLLKVGLIVDTDGRTPRDMVRVIAIEVQRRIRQT
jgi:hypothetical protein